MPNSNSYSGGTTITGGSVLLAANATGSATGSGDITIGPGGGLSIGSGGAAGAVAGNIANGGTVKFDRSDDTTYSGHISGTGNVTKQNVNTLILSGANTYSGGTTINGGTLLANNSIGSATGSDLVTVASGGSLGGTGAVGGPVAVAAAGTLTPGMGIGTLQINNQLTFANGAHLDYEVDSAASAMGNADLVNVLGDLSIQPTAMLDVTSTNVGRLAAGTKLTVLSFAGNWDGGEFSGLRNGKISQFNNQWFRVKYDDPIPGLNQGGGAYAKAVTLTAQVFEIQLGVAASPGHDATGENGLLYERVVAKVNNSGVAVGYGAKYVADVYNGERAVRWDASGVTVELDRLPGTDFDASAEVTAINNGGLAVGAAEKRLGTVSYGSRAVRWNAGNTGVTELGNLGTAPNGVTYSNAKGVNDAGTAVGSAAKYYDGFSYAKRAVRWEAADTAATELDGMPGTDANASSEALAINPAGMVIGQGDKLIGTVSYGQRAIRWDTAGAATELDTIGNQLNGVGFAAATALNDAGTVVGYSTKYLGNISYGNRAVRWDAGGTTATELGALGNQLNGVGNARAVAINNAGTAVGYSTKYLGNISYGDRAVRWDAGGTTATELGNLGLAPNGVTNSSAIAFNDAGSAVGRATKYDAGVSHGSHAVLWLPDASAVDLNDLGVVENLSGGTWELTEAQAISADGWVVGAGMFTPTGDYAYLRAWVAQVGLGGEWTDAISGTLDGTWGRGRQWSTGTPATKVGTATFSANAAYTVQLDRDETTRSTSVMAGDVRLNLAGHSLTSYLGVNVAPGATLRVTSAGLGNILADVTNDGTLALEAALGKLQVTGAYEQAATGDLHIELASASSSARLAASESLLLAGKLTLLLAGGYVPGSGTQFDILDWSCLGGTFSSLQLAPLPMGLTWDTSALYTTGVLTVTAVPTGDFTADGVVDARDYVRWRSQVGTLFQQSDFDVWRSHFGQVVGSTAFNDTTVPEPNLVLLLAVLATIVVARRQFGRPTNLAR